ncbi:MAG: 3-carboxy-cis,cis-muconate cycloisomerase [Candidatus Velthaea sp.]
MHTHGSDLFGALYGTDEMRALFSARARLHSLVEVEVALAHVQAALGIIPVEAAERIAATAAVDRLDLAAIVHGTEHVGYPIVPLTRQLAALAGPDAGAFVHWGATTQDIMDTGLVLALRRGLDILERDLSAIVVALAARARLHRDDVMAGRTHLQHALPVTFGFVCAGWLDPLIDALERLRAARTRALRVQFGGAVGTLASLGTRGRDVTVALAQALDLRAPDAPWHADRSAFVELACAVAIACGSLAKLATDIVLLMQTEVGEVFEPHAPGRGGSSTMPQKRNPIASEYVIACARGAQALVPLMLGAQAGDHQRSTGPWQTEEIALPQIFVLASGAFAHALAIVRGMTVDTARMRTNLDLTHGAIVSETVAMALAGRIGKAAAHHAVEAACACAFDEREPLIDVLGADARVSAHFDRAALAALLDPAASTGESGAVVDRVLSRVSSVLPNSL